MDMDMLLSPRRRLLLQGLSAAAIAAGCGDAARGPAAARPQAVFRGPTMGCLHGQAGRRAVGQRSRRRGAGAVEGALTEVVSRMSSYDADSELSRFNARGTLRPSPCRR